MSSGYQGHTICIYRGVRNDHAGRISTSDGRIVWVCQFQVLDPLNASSHFRVGQGPVGDGRLLCCTRC